MRMRSWVLLGIGYLAGTRAGREKFEQFKQAAQDFASSDAAADAMNRVRTTLGLTEPVSTVQGEVLDAEESEGDTETKSDDAGADVDTGSGDGDASKREDTTAEA